MSANHTPAPWQVVKDISGSIINCKCGFGIAEIHSRGGKEGRANASLIASAPDLLEAVKHALHVEKAQRFDLAVAGYPEHSAEISACDQNIEMYSKAVRKAEREEI